ncbi:MAG: hypothetical protein AB1486_27500 [Planctomycetota bacterium]
MSLRSRVLGFCDLCRSARLLSLVVLCGCFQIPERPVARDARRPLEELVAWTRELRGRAEVSGPAVRFASPAELSQRVQSALREGRTPATAGRESALRVLGLAVPAEPERSLEAHGPVAQQAVGFFDFRQHEVLVAADDPEHVDRELVRDEFAALTVSHEVAHALDEARFGIARQLTVAVDDDAREALAAVYEGLALAVNLDQYVGPRRLRGIDDPRVARYLQDRLEHLWQRVPAGELGIDDVEEIFGRELGAGERATVEPFLGAPLSVRAPILFRYFMGTRFVLAGCERFGAGVLDRIARDPPRSTALILHPERYFDRREEPWRIGARARQPPAPGAITVYDGVMGELALCLLLASRRGHTEGSTAAAAWRGDRLTLWRDGERESFAWMILARDEDGACLLWASLRAVLPDDVRAAREGTRVALWSALPEKTVSTLWDEGLPALAGLPPSGAGSSLLGTIASPLVRVESEGISSRTRVLVGLLDWRSWPDGAELAVFAPCRLFGGGGWAGPLDGGWVLDHRTTGRETETTALLHLLGWHHNEVLHAGEVRLEPLGRFRWGEACWSLDLVLGLVGHVEARADGEAKWILGHLFGRGLLGWERCGGRPRLHVAFLRFGL